MKPRRPHSLSDALTKCFGALGMSTAAEILGKSETWAYRLADPDSDCWPTIRQAVDLSVAYQNAGLGECPILEWVHDQVEDRTGEAPKRKPANPFEALRGLTKETSEGVAALITAIEKRGHLTRREHDEVLRELIEGRTAFDAVIRDFEATFSEKAPVSRLVPRMAGE